MLLKKLMALFQPVFTLSSQSSSPLCFFPNFSEQLENPISEIFLLFGIFDINMAIKDASFKSN